MKRSFLWLLLLFSVSALLAAPSVFNYQGKLTDAAGAGINDLLDMTIKIYDSPTGGTLLDQYDTTNVAVVKGLFDIQYEVDLGLDDLSGELYLELELEGGYTMIPRVRIAAVPFALAAMYVDSANHAVNADSVGGYSALQLLPNTLQGAYDEGGAGAGRRIDAVSGPVDIRTAYIGPADGRAMEIRTNDNIETALYVYNAGTGPAIFCSGDLRLNGTIWSNSDVKIQLDKNADPTNSEFFVVNDTGATVFSVNEHGDAVIIGELDPKSVTFMPQAVIPTGIKGKVYFDDAEGKLKWHDGTAWQDFGTGGGTGDYIENQIATTQDADFWVEREGAFGVVTVGTETDVLTEGFEGGVIPPTGWTQNYVSGTNDWELGPTGTTASSVHSGAACAVFRGNYTNYVTELISPSIDLSGFPAGSVTFEFWHMQPDWSGDQDTLAVYYSSDGGANWNYLESWGGSVTTYQHRTYVLPDLSNNYMVKFYAFENWGYGVHLDDIRIYNTEYSEPSPRIIAQGSTGNIALLDPAGDVVFDGVGLKSPGGAGVVGYDNATSGLAASDVQAAIDELAAIDPITSLDVLWAGDFADYSDTILAMDNLYINGELIADSIQAFGDTIYLDDHISVDGCGVFGGGVAPSTILYSESFDGGSTPSGWAETGATGSAAITYLTTSVHPTGITPSDGSHMAVFNSWTASTGNQIQLEQTAGFSTVGYSGIIVYLDIYHDMGFTNLDSVVLQYSTDGTTWNPVKRWLRYDGTFGWASEWVALPSGADNQPNLYLALLFVSAYGNDIHVDNLVVRAPTGAAPPAVEICSGGISADGDIEGGTFTLNGVTITDWPSGGGTSDLDTLWTPHGSTFDTMVAMAQFKVFGELIADSIQAVGNIIEMDDSVNIVGGVSLGGDSTYRDDWEPEYVITVGKDNADFETIQDAVAAVLFNGWRSVLIDVAPGIYPVPSALTIPDEVHLRGSGANATTIIADINIRGKVSYINFMTSPVVLANGAQAIHCTFEDNTITIDDSRADNCVFKTRETMLNIRSNSALSGCEIQRNVDIEGVCVISDALMFGTTTVHGPSTQVDFNGCVVSGGNIIVNADASIFVEACLFLAGEVDIAPAITIMLGSAEIKANHFIDRNMNAINIMGGSANILSNDFIRCGKNMDSQGAIFALGSFREFNIIGNHIDGQGLSMSPGIQAMGSASSEGLIKDNVIERHITGVRLSGMNQIGNAMPVNSNIIRKNQNDGLVIEAGNYLLTHNVLTNNNLAGALFNDLMIQTTTVVASHNVVDSYTSVVSPVPGAFNTQSSGMIWGLNGQLP